MTLLGFGLGLIRWGIVIHGYIDGYSRLITGLRGSDNNMSQTVLDLFLAATTVFGVPYRLCVMTRLSPHKFIYLFPSHCDSYSIWVSPHGSYMSAMRSFLFPFSISGSILKPVLDAHQPGVYPFHYLYYFPTTRLPSNINSESGHAS